MTYSMKKQNINLTHDTVPASVGLVKEVRDELKAELRAVEHGLNSKIEIVNTKIEQVLISVHRSQVLMEEQRGENRIVLDGIKNLFERQVRIDTEVSEIKTTVSTLGHRTKF